RSLHFIGLVLFSGFIIMHVALVFVVHPEHNVVNMVFGGGEVTAARGAQGVVIMVSTIVAVIVFWIALSSGSLADRAGARRCTETGRAILLSRLRPVGSRKKSLTDKDISEFHWTNGLPPTAEESQLWTQARENDWEGLTITLRDDINDVEKTVTVDDIKALP